MVTSGMCDAVDETSAASGGKGALPAQNGPVGAHADDVLVSWAYPDLCDVATVSNPDVSHFTLVIIPDFDHMVIPT